MTVNDIESSKTLKSPTLSNLITLNSLNVLIAEKKELNWNSVVTIETTTMKQSKQLNESEKNGDNPNAMIFSTTSHINMKENIVLPTLQASK